MGWTLAILVIFLSASQIPLYGVPTGLISSMPSDIMRVVLASGHGTIMDLGEQHRGLKIHDRKQQDIKHGY